MPTRGEQWIAEHTQARERTIRVRIDAYEVEPGAGGLHEVTIKGFGLYRAVAPPRVLVGGMPVEQLRFQDDGAVLRGLLPHEPRERGVVVDYGFARAELRE